MNKCKVLLLAGGDSTRFWPVSDKHLVKFYAKPLLYYSLLQLEKFGLKDIVIVVNEYNEAKIKLICTQFTGMHIALVKQTDKNGMAGAVLSCKELIKAQELLIIGPSDIYEDILLADFLKMQEKNVEGIITGITVKDYFPGGYLVFNQDNYIQKIIEKPAPDKLPSHTVSIVFDYFKNSDKLIAALQKVKTGDSDNRFEAAIQQLIEQGHKFKLLTYKGFWGYLKYPWHILHISSYFLDKITSQKIKKAMIADSAVIEGNVLIEDGVRVMENAKIIGPSYIGKNVLVGNNSIVRESMIGANSVIGFSSEIARSYVGENCSFHINYVGDSVIGDNLNMGAGTKLANLRLDEASIKSNIAGQIINTHKKKLGAIIGNNVKIGINASIMPGVKIGKNSFIGSAVLLDEDIADDKYCYVKSKGLNIRNNRSSIKSTE